MMDEIIELSEIIDSLAEIAKKKGITNAEISKRTGLKESNVSRFLLNKQAPSLKTLVRIAKSLEVQIKFKF